MSRIPKPPCAFLNKIPQFGPATEHYEVKGLSAAVRVGIVKFPASH